MYKDRVSRAEKNDADILVRSSVSDWTHVVVAFALALYCPAARA